MNRSAPLLAAVLLLVSDTWPDYATYMSGANRQHSDTQPATLNIEPGEVPIAPYGDVWVDASGRRRPAFER